MILPCDSSSREREFHLRRWSVCFNPSRERTVMRDEKCSNAGTSGDEGNGNAAPPLGRSADSPAHDAALVTWLPMLLQTTDALFPTGAYAHSLGFEELLRLCGVRDEVGLRELVDTHVLPVLMHQDLPYLRFAYQTVEGPAL